MLQLRENVKIFINSTPIDMRKAIDGLCALVIDYFTETPQSGHLFLFYNGAKNRVKILYWDRNGFVLHYKRLERGRFHIKPNSKGNIEITEQQLRWLLAGLDFQTMQQFSELNYSDYY